MKPQPCALTKQSLFDSTVLHLAAQGRQSKTASGCLYRGPNGLKCAVGFHITDDEYDFQMENKSVYNLFEENLLPFRLKGFVDLLEYLQNAHDDGNTRSSMARLLINTAKAYDLDDRSVRAAFAEHLS